MSQINLAGVLTYLIYDGSDLVAEYNSAGTLLRRYVHGPGVDEPLVWYEGSGTANKAWLYGDHQGSIVAAANSTGNAIALHSYGPYGEPNATTGVRFRYTGQQLLGSLNLYYYKARMYSPVIGRFLQTDPIGYQDGLNLYAYVGNNPLNRRDPSGLRPYIDIYSTPEDAATTALLESNGLSIDTNTEFGGAIYQENGETGYRYTVPFSGTSDESDVMFPPSGTTWIAMYHTHAAYDPTVIDELGVDRNINFSWQKNGVGDIPTANWYNKTSYMIDPNWDIHKYDPYYPSVTSRYDRAGEIMQWGKSNATK